MSAKMRSVLPYALAATLLVLSANPNVAGAKEEAFSFFASANFSTTDASGLVMTVSVSGADRPIASDDLFISISQTNPACEPPEADCPFVLLRGIVEWPLSEEDVQIQRNLRWARLLATVEFVDEISGNTFPLVIDLKWKATTNFPPDPDGTNFQKADATGTVSLAGSELVNGQIDSNSEISRFLLSG